MTKTNQAEDSLEAEDALEDEEASAVDVDHPENRVGPSAPVPGGSIALDVFCRRKWGKKQDQAAGFKHYAAKKKLSRMARAAWDEALAKFESGNV